MPVWHVSVARQGEAGPEAITEGTDLEPYRKLAIRILTKVGNRKVEYEEVTEIALHYRRQLITDEVEIARMARPYAAVFKLIKNSELPS